MYNKHKMFEGGSFNKSRSMQVFRFASLFIPIVLISYSSMVQTGLIPVSQIINNDGLILFSFWWLYITIIQFLFPSKSSLDSALRLVAYHLLAGSFLVFVSGVASPVTAIWLLLTTASYALFSKKGLYFNFLTLLVFIFIDIFLWYRVNSLVVVYDLFALIIVSVIGIIIINIINFQNLSKKELSDTKTQELLQRDRISTIINNLADAVISTDKDGLIKVYNAACLNLLDTNASLNNKHIDEILPLKDADNKDVGIFKEFQSSKTVTKRDDLIYNFGEDDNMRLEATYSPIHSSFSRSKQSQNHDGYIIILRDITKSKSLEEERDEFISVVSHELRTPITIAEGSISNVQAMMGHPDVTDSMLKDAMNVAHEQVIFLASMVNDLSTLSRAERGVAGDKEEIDVHDLAKTLHDKYIVDAKNKGLHLNLDVTSKIDKIQASRLYIEELLQNLITNSIKYTKKGSVDIIIRQKDDLITFAIKDTGIGISKSDQNKLFNKFFRSEDYRTRETSGTGLGLYIAAKLAHKLGTKIILKSRLNFGSTFSFTMPTLKKTS